VEIVFELVWERIWLRLEPRFKHMKAASDL
jgi:hypothetical protein